MLRSFLDGCALSGLRSQPLTSNRTYESKKIWPRQIQQSEHHRCRGGGAGAGRATVHRSSRSTGSFGPPLLNGKHDLPTNGGRRFQSLGQPERRTSHEKEREADENRVRPHTSRSVIASLSYCVAYTAAMGACIS